MANGSEEFIKKQRELISQRRRQIEQARARLPKVTQTALRRTTSPLKTREQVRQVQRAEEKLGEREARLQLAASRFESGVQRFQREVAAAKEAAAKVGGAGGLRESLKPISRDIARKRKELEETKNPTTAALLVRDIELLNKKIKEIIRQEKIVTGKIGKFRDEPEIKEVVQVIEKQTKPIVGGFLKPEEVTTRVKDVQSRDFSKVIAPLFQPLSLERPVPDDRIAPIVPSEAEQKRQLREAISKLKEPLEGKTIEETRQFQTLQSELARAQQEIFRNPELDPLGLIEPSLGAGQVLLETGAFVERTLTQRPTKTVKEVASGALEVGRRIVTGEGFPEGGRLIRTQPLTFLGRGAGEIVAGLTIGKGIEELATLGTRTITRLRPDFIKVQIDPNTGKQFIQVQTLEGRTINVPFVKNWRDFRENLQQQAALQGIEIDAITAARNLFKRFQQEVTVSDVGSTFGAFFDPRGRLRTGRLFGEGSASAKLLDFLTGDVKVVPIGGGRLQAVIVPQALVEVLPKTLSDVSKALIEGRKLTTSQINRLKDWQKKVLTGTFKPIGRLTTESEVTAAVGEVLEKQATLGRTIIQGKPIEIIQAGIRDVGRSTTGLVEDLGKTFKTETSQDPTFISQSFITSAGLQATEGISGVKAKEAEPSSDIRKEFTLPAEGGSIVFAEPSGDLGSITGVIPTFRQNFFEDEPSPEPEPEPTRPKPLPISPPTTPIRGISFTPSTPISQPTPPIVSTPFVPSGGTPFISTPSTPTRTTTPFAPPFVPRSSKRQLTKVSKKGEILVRAFRVFVKRKGKFVAVGKPLPRAEALRKGSEIVRTTLAATFKIKPTSKFVRPASRTFIPSSQVFRSFKVQKGRKIPLADTFIQRRQFRLGTRTERREIQRARRVGGFLR